MPAATPGPLPGLLHRLPGIGFAGGPPQAAGNGGFAGLIVDFQFVANKAAISLTVPPQANFCEVVCIGFSGGGSPAGGSNSRPSAGGGGAMARSRFAVSAGDTLSVSSTQLSSSQAPTTLTYKNVVVCSADYGRAALETNIAGSANGAGGKTSNCIYNVEARPGGDGTLIGGGIQAIDKNGNGWFNNTVGLSATGPGMGGNATVGVNQSTGSDTTLSTYASAVGGGGGGSYGQTGTSYNGGQGGKGAIYIIYYQV